MENGCKGALVYPAEPVRVFTVRDRPGGLSLVISFCKWDYTQGFRGITFNGGVNYLNMWKDDWFLASFRNTLLFSVGFVPITLVLALLISVLMDRYVYNKRSCQLFFFMPYISNVVAVSIVWVIMLSSSGPITMFIRSLGWRIRPSGWATPPPPCQALC